MGPFLRENGEQVGLKPGLRVLNHAFIGTAATRHMAVGLWRLSAIGLYVSSNVYSGRSVHALDMIRRGHVAVSRCPLCAHPIGGVASDDVCKTRRHALGEVVQDVGSRKSVAAAADWWRRLVLVAVTLTVLGRGRSGVGRIRFEWRLRRRSQPCRRVVPSYGWRPHGKGVLA